MVLTAQNLKLFGKKLKHFLNDVFQSCHDLFQVNPYSASLTLN